MPTDHLEQLTPELRATARRDRALEGSFAEDRAEQEAQGDAPPPAT